MTAAVPSAEGNGRPRLAVQVLGRSGAPASPRSILVVQTQRIGDTTCFTPLLEALRAIYPEVRLAAIVQPPCNDLLANNPYLNEVLVYDPSRDRGLRGALRLVQRLRQLEADWALSVHAASTVALALALARIPWRTAVWRYGDRKPPHWRRLFHQSLVQERDLGRQHEVDYNLDLLRALGLPAEDITYGIFPGEEDRQAITALLDEFALPPEAALAVVHPGHGGGRQQWPPERYGQVARGLAEEHGLAVLITGAPDQQALADRVVAASGGCARSVAGRLSLMQLAALLDRVRLFVSVSTGPMHLAAAMGAPCVTLYGPTDLRYEAVRYSPYGVPARQVLSAIVCPCPSAKTCQTAECMAAITTTAVLDACGSLLTHG